MNPFDAFTQTLDLTIVLLGTVALFGVPLRAHFFHDSATRGKLFQVEIITVLMVAVSLFGLMRGGA